MDHIVGWAFVVCVVVIAVVVVLFELVHMAGTGADKETSIMPYICLAWVIAATIVVSAMVAMQPMSYAAEVTVVCVVAITVTAMLFALVHVFRKLVVENRLIIPYICLAWSVAAGVVISVTVALQTSPAESLFTTKSWLSGGWHTGMNLFSIKIDSWQRYLLVLVYQIVRSILGSLITNVFRSYLLVTIQSGSGGKARKDRVGVVLGAQAAYNCFSYASALSDSFILMGQADMTLVTVVVTVLADAISTVYFMADVGADKRASDQLPQSSTHVMPLPDAKLKDRRAGELRLH